MSKPASLAPPSPARLDVPDDARRSKDCRAWQHAAPSSSVSGPDDGSHARAAHAVQCARGELLLPADEADAAAAHALDDRRRGGTMHNIASATTPEAKPAATQWQHHAPAFASEQPHAPHMPLSAPGMPAQPPQIVPAVRPMTCMPARMPACMPPPACDAACETTCETAREAERVHSDAPRRPATVDLEAEAAVRKAIEEEARMALAQAEIICVAPSLLQFSARG
eukprot:330672-Pleurochrysis_carterae.AAC.1